MVSVSGIYSPSLEIWQNFSTIASGLLVLNASFASSAPSGMLKSIMKAFGMSQVEGTLTVSLFIGTSRHATAKQTGVSWIFSWILCWALSVGADERASRKETHFHHRIFRILCFSDRMCSRSKCRCLADLSVFERMFRCLSVDEYWRVTRYVLTFILPLPLLNVSPRWHVSTFEEWISAVFSFFMKLG